MAVQIQVLNCPKCNIKLATANKTRQGRFELELMPSTQFDAIHQTLTCPVCQGSFDVKTQLPPPHLAIIIKGSASPKLQND
jgi:uncharacterized protein YbaR (Trm112 family)